jgi:hypothetical protein
MDIKIGKTGRECRATGLPFAHEAEVVSLVRPDEDGLVREDYAREAWTDQYGEGALAVWTTRYIDPDTQQDAEKEEERSPVREAFYACQDSEARPDLARAFLAAQLLKRQRAFRLVRESAGEEPDQRTYLYLDRSGDRLVEVRDPGLTFAELEAARAELLAALAAVAGDDDSAPEEGEHGDASGVRQAE